MEINNACLDSYDERNYNYEEMLGSSINLPKSVLLETGFRQNQQEDGYIMGCTYYAGAEASNYLTKQRLQGKDFIKNSKTRDNKAGDYIINATKLLVSEGIIAGYAQVNTLDSIKLSLANNRPIHTGSNKIIWSKITKDNGFIAVPGSGYGHSFHIIGYDDNKQYLICKNSYGPTFEDKGNFYIKYEDIEVLMNTKLSLIENKTLIDNYKQKIMDGITLESAKKAFENGIWNGQRPKENITREEARAMIERVLEKLIK